MSAGPGVGPLHDTVSMHSLKDLDVTETNNRLRVTWSCECGTTGSGATQRTAHTGYRRHVKTATIRENR